MTLRHVTAGAAIGAAALLLAACSAGSITSTSPSAQPDDTGAPTTCDESVFSDNVDADLIATASPLDDLAYPLDGIESAGLNVVCTAHLSVDYAEGRTVEFDILVTDADLDDTTAALDDAAAEQGWVSDADAPIWRDPDDQNHFVEALTVDEGVLVGSTVAG